jgi:hypothetical protein
MLVFSHSIHHHLHMPPYSEYASFVHSLRRTADLCPPGIAPGFLAEIATCTTPEILRLLHDGEAPHKTAIEEAINEYRSTRSWPSNNQATLFYLRERLLSASEAMESFCSAGLHPESSLFDLQSHFKGLDLLVFLATYWADIHAGPITVRRWIADLHDRSILP